MTPKSSISLTLIGALGIILVLGFFAGRLFRDPARATVIAGMTVLEPAAPLPEFRLHDQNNRLFDRARLQGKWSYVFFGYTRCPDICPTTLVVLRDARKLAGGAEQDVQYIFVSVDPARDKAADLKNYLPYFHPEFVGATGGRDELMRLARAFGAYYESGAAPAGNPRTASGAAPALALPHSYEVQHSAAIFLVDPETRLRALFAGPHDAARLAHGLRRLKGD